MMNEPALLVGAPCRNREWIIKEWISHIEASAWNAGVEPGFVMVGEAEDEAIIEVYKHCLANDRFFQLVEIQEGSKGDQPGKRTWNHDRYRYMADLRNRLLTAVRLYQPGAFLSVDTDILVHPDTIGLLSESLPGYGAVGGKAYLSHVGRAVPNHAFLRSGGGQCYRSDHEGGVIATQVIMALKLMSPDTYSIDYQWDHRGEDFGWSASVLKQGFKLGWDARVTNKHVMTPAKLGVFDKRCGY